MNTQLIKSFKKLNNRQRKKTTSSYQVVTALFDIGREALDGRSTQFYLNELHKLLIHYPNAIIFHNCIDLDFQNNSPNATYIYQEISSLPFSQYQSDINSIIQNFGINTESKDLVHRTSEYGIIINSKLHFLEIASKQTNAQFLVWIDAGVTRFFQDSEIDRFKLNLPTLSPSIDGIFQIDALNWMRQRKLSFPPSSWIKVNHSTRIISGGIFIIRTEKAPFFSLNFERIVLQSLRQGSWDTEQMYFFFLLSNFRIKYVLQRFNHPVSIFEMNYWKRYIKYNFLDVVIRALLPKVASKPQ